MQDVEGQPPERRGADADLERYGRYRVPRRRTSPTPDLEPRELRRGTKPGTRYVRLTPRRERPFRRVGESEYQATEVAIRPRSFTEQLWRLVKRVLIGPPLATSQLIQERLSKAKALAVFASDNLSSSAYATEELLLILILAGTQAFQYSIPIAIAIVVLVGVVALSYSQVIRGYPNGGGAYVVAKENLGLVPGMVAGASLIANYIVLVAVSVAAGVAAITSAAPELYDYRVIIALLLVAGLTLANLRGIRESATLFALPAYAFIVAFGAMLVVGLIRIALGHDLAARPPSDTIAAGGQAVTLFLLLRAFSSGSAALTGIEAVSNGVPAFKPPETRNAVIVLAWVAVLLSAFFLGTTVLAYQLDAVPAESKTIIAQVAEAVFGTSPLFYIVQITTMLILILAANTSFAGLPSLAAVMARDRVLPRQFAFRGDRLAFSNGIIVLGLASAALLIVFQAETHALIPLYAVGVFIGFTLAQTGLVVHWRRERTPGARVSLIINALGAVITAVVTIIVTVTKFVDGAWITLGGMLLLVFFFTRIHHHYRRVQEQLEVTEPPTLPAPPEDRRDGHITAIVPVDEVNKAVMRTLAYARTITENVVAVHVTDELEEGERLRQRWEELVPDTPIVIIESPYRSFVAPFLAYIDALDRAEPGRPITVVLPEFVPAHAWEGLLHNQSAIRLKKALLKRPNTILIDVPYHLKP